MENMGMTNGFWQDRRVFITGHTGFKGGWLTLSLCAAGAKVYGYSLKPPTEPSLFTVARIEGGLSGHAIADVRDGDTLRREMKTASPSVVFHLAAQPIVRESYRDPACTYAVNVMGTVNMLEAVRATPGTAAVVNVTTDKCYENKEWAWGYRESEPLGGRDPYSSSKACSELVTSAYRESFLADAGVAVASARAGNVIGGGDWAAERLVPDFFRAMAAGSPLVVRYPGATRPWQHVLEPVTGYLLLAEQLVSIGASRAKAWNFGPADDDARPVSWLLDRLAERCPGAAWKQADGSHVHEAGYLKLDSSLARNELRWRPRWGLQVALEKTIEWQNAWQAGADMGALSLRQIREHDLAPSA
jgi:CDP-glucose 4,6-dehydratase